VAIVLGTNVGFVATRPTVSPAAANGDATLSRWALKHTSPAGSNNLVELGWHVRYFDAADTFRMALYAHDAANDRPGALLALTAADIAVTSENWFYGAASYALAASTVYWMALLRANPSRSEVGWDDLTGARVAIDSVTSLSDPWGSSSEQYGDVGVALYARYEPAGGGSLSIPVAMHHRRMQGVS
jgi:hypothetical protein